MEISNPHVPNDARVFEDRESSVRSYCRRMPSVFTKGCNARVWDESGAEFIDFFTACGALNYGHNDPAIKQAALAHIEADAILCGVDLHTSTKRRFLEDFQHTILLPRGLDYKVQFPGPTGTNAIEAALKLARKVTRRRAVVAFSRAFHGMSLGALAATANARARRGAGVPLPDVVRLAYDGDEACGLPDLDQYEAAVRAGQSLPAAFLVETVQGEGGLRVASVTWLRRLAALARRLGAVLIVDDIQAGCGRTGSFFSFERAAIQPDIVCLAKSISGFGLPMALVLIKPRFDIWAPGEHNGTFRGNNLAFATASAALLHWQRPDFRERVQANEELVRTWGERIAATFGEAVAPCGIGLMTGLRFARARDAEAVARLLVADHLLIETAGPQDEVLKVMPPLTIEEDLLREGLDRITRAVLGVLHPMRREDRAAA